MRKRSPTTKDISLLEQLHKNGQLNLAPEFQRNAVWPRQAKAYLIDTILHDRPMPLFFFVRGRDAQNGRPTYAVIDGQQRLRAIFEYLEGRFSLPMTKEKNPWDGKKYPDLSTEDQSRILNYDLVVEELSSYDSNEIRDVFVRMNKYVVKLSPQELRNAQKSGAFHNFANEVGEWPFWRESGVFSPLQMRRMKSAELAAELAILLIEGPQDKKAAVDLYYTEYAKTFQDSSWVKIRLKKYFSWLSGSIAQFSESRFRKPVDLYSLIGALESATAEGSKLSKLDPQKCTDALRALENDIHSEAPSEIALRYALAASQQTDNITPRLTRIDILANVLRSA